MSDDELTKPRCYDCDYEIVAEDDEAMVCVQCGGKNRRKS